MLSFTISRLMQGCLVVLVMSFLLYMLIGLMPGDPVENMLEGNPALTPELARQFRELHGAGVPLPVRYWNWLVAAVQGDFGYSSLYSRPTFGVLVPALSQTLILMLATLVVGIPLAVILGVVAARQSGGWADNIIGFLSFASISMPGFWLSLIMIMVFSVQLGWLPTSGTPLRQNASLQDHVVHMILPVASLVLYFVGPPLRYVRASMIETLSADYIRTARAKGLAEATVLMRHALRNALIPMVTVVALSFGSLFSGALVTEVIFGILGMGKMIFDAVRLLDFNLALVGLLLATVVTVLANLFADLAYAWLDPRITLQ